MAVNFAKLPELCAGQRFPNDLEKSRKIASRRSLRRGFFGTGAR